MNNNITVRVASVKDAKALLDIYTPYVKDTVITFEYEVPTLKEFEERISNTLTKYPYLVAEKNNEIVGYAYAGEFKGRAAYDWAVETSIYVKVNCRKMGIGKILYNSLEKALSTQNILNLNACIAYPIVEDKYLSKNSVQFHEHLGYRLVGRFYKCAYKFGKWYDMVWMEKHIGHHTENPSKVIPFNNLK